MKVASSKSKIISTVLRNPQVKAERAEFCKEMEAGLSNTHRISPSGPDNTTTNMARHRFLRIRFGTLDDTWDFPLDK
jgi:hypothetical protein